jgi:hypothetical protein
MKVLLIHGLGRTPLSLLSLEQRLSQVGWATEQFGYIPFVESYDAIVVRLQQRLRVLAHQEPYGIVAHSLGGLLTRSALAWLGQALPQQIVMLGTPNRPPRLATYAWQVPPFRWFAGQCGSHLANPEFFNQLPRPNSPYTIIAGTHGWNGPFSPFGSELNDGIVALNETYIEASDPVVRLPVNHTFMMLDPNVQEKVVGIFAQHLTSARARQKP